MSEETWVAVISILVGVALILFNKWFANNMLEFHTRIWGLNLGEKYVVFVRVLAVAISILSIAFGLSLAFKITHLRR